MRGLHRTWLTIDTDDLRHVPSNQGHPTRSNPDNKLPDISEQFRAGIEGLRKWLGNHELPVTLFVIADQCDSEEFVQMIAGLCSKFGKRITIGCHGLHHRSWSAWPEDSEGFSEDLSASVSILEHHFPNHFRRWFRAPAGYMASWMIPVLVEQNFIVDTSINPSWLVNRKYAKGESWKTVHSNVMKTPLIERPWKTRFTLPTCGPAQHIPGLRWNAKRAWKTLANPLQSNEIELVENREISLDTVYWHILDHARKNGSWVPPLKAQ